MYKVIFYQDKNGRSAVKKYFAELLARKDKDNRIKLGKIRDYVKILSEYGTFAGEPYIKHLEGKFGSLGQSGIEFFLRPGMAEVLYFYIVL